MYLRGPVLIGFSALCLFAASLANEKAGSGALTERLARVTQKGSDCRSSGISTPQGYVGCLQPTSASFGEFLMGGAFGDSGAMNRR